MDLSFNFGGKQSISTQPIQPTTHQPTTKHQPQLTKKKLLVAHGESHPACVASMRTAFGVLGIEVEYLPVAFFPMRYDSCSQKYLPLAFELATNRIAGRNVDAFFVCGIPADGAQSFLPFNKPIVLLVDNFFEANRLHPNAVFEWASDLAAMLQDKSRFVVATHEPYWHYHTRYLTRLQVPVIPWFNFELAQADVKDQNWSKTAGPQQRDRKFLSNLILFNLRRSKARYLPEQLIEQVNKSETLKSSGLHTSNMWEYDSETIFELSQARAIVTFPYFVCSGQFLEFYQMNIPVYIPSFELWDELSLHTLGWQEIWAMTSILGPPPDIACLGNPCLNFKHYRKTWFRLSASMYPGVQFFDNATDLVAKILSANFTRIREQMTQHSARQQETATAAWRVQLTRLLTQNELDETAGSTNSDASGSVKLTHAELTHNYTENVKKGWPLLATGLPFNKELFPCGGCESIQTASSGTELFYLGSERGNCSLVNTPYIMSRIDQYKKAVGVGLDHPLYSEAQNPDHESNASAPFGLKFALSDSSVCSADRMAEIIEEAKSMNGFY